MGRPRRLGRLLPILAALGFALASVELRAADGPAGSVDRPDAKTTRGTTHKVAGKTRRKKITSKGKATAERPKPASTRTKLARGRTKAPREQAHTINDNIEITPFPSHAAAARKALAQNRRDQLDDAEKAARDPRQSDRWQTVLFHLRGFDSRTDAEACFWRVVAYYRLGEIGRARTIRQSCDIAPTDLSIVEKEDVQAASLQPAAALPELAAAGERPPAPVPNPAGYEGVSPTRLER